MLVRDLNPTNSQTYSKLTFFVGLVVLLFAGQVFAKVQVDSVRLWRAPDNTRLVLDLSEPVDHRLFTLKSPSRIVIDLSDAELNTGFDDLALGNTPIKNVRSAARDGKDLRIVLDLTDEVTPRSFTLAKQTGKSDRLVIDLFDTVAPTVKTAEALVTHQQRDILIAIDAGHGGEDPGAIGHGGLLEKHVVLDIAKELAKLIDAEPGFQAELVRTGDYYIPLLKRRDYAREKRADLFVSIHADAFTKAQANGASVFALSQRGATSETARFLAQQENEADLIGGVTSVNLEDKSPDVQSVLVDLFMKATLTSSLEVGHDVLSSMGKVARLHKSSVEQAGFAVLKSPDVPSILVETGFISNPRESKNLGSKNYRRKMAKQIFTGVKTYFNRTPPAGTYIAWKKSGNEREYVIATGDTLSTIARKHNTSVSAIRQHNGLNSDTIRVGQRLKIPAT